MNKIPCINPITPREFNVISHEYLNSIKDKNIDVISINIKKASSSAEAFYDLGIFIT